MEQDKPLVIGTRGSHLALWQAHYLQAQLAQLGVRSELSIIKTKGDNIQHLSFDKIEGKGFFTKEIEDALLAGKIDVAVHSMKDLPTEATEGLVIAAVSQRADVADCLLVHQNAFDENNIFNIKKSSRIGTSSSRRKAQFLAFRPDVHLMDLRGNVPTRVEKLRKGEFDGILLAAAGIERLEIDLSPDILSVRLNPREFVPAPAQGVLAFQTLRHDLHIRRILQKIHHSEVSDCTNVERGVLRLLQGGCQMPVGVYCERDPLGNYHVWASVAEAWNSPIKTARLSSSTSYGLAENILKKLNV